MGYIPCRNCRNATCYLHARFDHKSTSPTALQDVLVFEWPRNAWPLMAIHPKPHRPSFSVNAKHYLAFMCHSQVHLLNYKKQNHQLYSVKRSPNPCTSGLALLHTQNYPWTGRSAALRPSSSLLVPMVGNLFAPHVLIPYAVDEPSEHEQLKPSAEARCQKAS